MTTPAEDLHAALRQRGATVSTAESLTGGRLAGLLTAVPGASATYVGGAVTYATRLKVSLLAVPQAVVDDAGVVSAACAAAMASGVRELTGSTVGLSTTGVAGPTEQEGKPVGTVYVGVADATGVETLALHLDGDREAVVEATCLAVLAAARERLRRPTGDELAGGDHPEGPSEETSLR